MTTEAQIVKQTLKSNEWLMRAIALVTHLRIEEVQDALAELLN